jgi:hypothetical protein
MRIPWRWVLLYSPNVMISPNLFFVYSATKFDHEQLLYDNTLENLLRVQVKSQIPQAWSFSSPACLLIRLHLPGVAARSGSQGKDEDRWLAGGGASQVTNAPSLIFLIPCLPVKQDYTWQEWRQGQPRGGWVVGRGPPLSSWAFFVTGGKHALLCHCTPSLSGTEDFL